MKVLHRAIRSIQGHYAGCKLHDGKVVSISDIMVEFIVDIDIELKPFPLP
ncbi:hypothetical protein [Staphylococcus debuckii]